MISRRQILIALGASAVASTSLSFAQQPVRSVRIGFLGSGSAAGYADMIAALREGLRDRGYAEGRNLVIEFRWADEKYDRLPALAAELVRVNVDVIVTHGAPGTRAAQKATRTIPIVMATSGDAVATGLVASLARPGGNTTGLTALGYDMMRKRLELLKEIMPHLSRVAVLLNANNPANSAIVRSMEGATRSLKLGLQTFDVRGPGEFENVFAAMAKMRVIAVTSSQEGMFLSNARRISEAAIAQRIAVAGGKESAEAGALIGYGPNFLEMYRHTATFVDKIVNGARPGDLPVEQPTKFELIVNLRTAKALGLRMPQALLLRAERIIE